MYKVNNEYCINVFHQGEYPWNSHRYFIDYIYSEKELIKYLANGYHFNIFLDGGNPKDKYNYNNKRFKYSYKDNYNRIINPFAYEYDAWKYYLNFLLDKEDKYSYFKNKVYYTPQKGIPISNTGKKRGGPSVHPRKLKHIALMYSNPEYKKFNRGSRSDYPNGWWDDFYRHTEKNWKRQSKRRHQWKEK